MTCGAHTASQHWRRHRCARDTSPETPDIDRAPRALSCTYTFDPVQWVGTCKRNRPEPTKHAPAMPMARNAAPAMPTVERQALSLTNAFTRRTAHRACSHEAHWERCCNVGKQVGARYAIAASAATLANRAQCLAVEGCGGVQSTALRELRLPLAVCMPHLGLRRDGMMYSCVSSSHILLLGKTRTGKPCDVTRSARVQVLSEHLSRYCWVKSKAPKLPLR